MGIRASNHQQNMPALLGAVRHAARAVSSRLHLVRPLHPTQDGRQDHSRRTGRLRRGRQQPVHSTIRSSPYATLARTRSTFGSNAIHPATSHQDPHLRYTQPTPERIRTHCTMSTPSHTTRTESPCHPGGVDFAKPPHIADSTPYVSAERHVPSSKKYKRTSFRGPNGERQHKYTHNFHWYPAKLFPQIPAHFLDLADVRPGTVVLDPFCGSGTVLVEASVRDCLPIGFDIHPLARLISRAKTTPLSTASLKRLLDAIMQHTHMIRAYPPADRMPHYWFTAPARAALYRIYTSITTVATTPAIADFFLASLTSITRRCSLADPYIPPPVRMNPRRFSVAGHRYQTAYNRVMAISLPEVYQMFETAVKANIQRLGSFQDPRRPRAQISPSSALNMPLPDRSVDVAITSPPYCGAQKYIRTFRLELLLLGYSASHLKRLERHTLGSEKAIWSQPFPSPVITPRQTATLQQITARNPRRARMLELYLDGLHKFVAELERVLKPGAHAFVTLGQSHFSQIPVDLADHFLEFADRFGYTLQARFTDQIPARLMITKRSSTANVIRSENILWLRKTQ